MNGPNRRLNHYCSSTFLKLISHQLNLLIMLSLFLLLSYSTQLIAADKPLLSEAIAKGIDNHGVAATAEMFAKSFENDKDAYTVDMDGVANLGTEIVDGETVTHYYKNERNPGYEYGYNSYDYWVDNNGIMVKMQLIEPEVSQTLQLKDITLSSQDEMLFVPPQGYRKAGHNISWKDEKKKLD